MSVRPDFNGVVLEKCFDKSFEPGPAAVRSNARSRSVIWMSYGGMTLDRIRHLPCQDLPTLFLRLIHQGLQGLQVLWTQHGMVHGDVKPFNVGMDQTNEGWRWRYIDYGGLSYTNHYLDPDFLVLTAITGTTEPTVCLTFLPSS